MILFSGWVGLAVQLYFYESQFGALLAKKLGKLGHCTAFWVLVWMERFDFRFVSIFPWLNADGEMMQGLGQFFSSEKGYIQFVLRRKFSFHALQKPLLASWMQEFARKSHQRKEQQHCMYRELDRSLRSCGMCKVSAPIQKQKNVASTNDFSFIWKRNDQRVLF